MRKTFVYRPKPPAREADKVEVREVALEVGGTELIRRQFKAEDTEVVLGSFEVAEGQTVSIFARDGDAAGNFSDALQVYSGTPVKDTVAPEVPLAGEVEITDEAEEPAPAP